MKYSQVNYHVFISLLLAFNFVFSVHLFGTQDNTSNKISLSDNEELSSKILKILDSKCNVCHRKQNPFMVFNERNIKRRAEKINRMVFEERKMPKGDEIRLSDKEYATLEAWLFSLNIY